MTYSLLVIEDDPDISLALANLIVREGFDVVTASSASEGLKYVKIQKFHVILLDLGLPDYDGLEVCKKIKTYTSTPVIIISAQNNREAKLQAFRLGADDYICKPFDKDEVMARIWVAIRRTSEIHEPFQNTSVFRIDDESGVIYQHESLLLLTNIEYKILRYFIMNKNNLVTKEMLRELLHIENDDRSSIDFHIKNIRKKIEKTPKQPEYLKTLYGQGFILSFS